MRRETCFTPFEGGFEILIGCTVQPGKWEMSGKTGLVGKCTKQPSLYLQTGMCLA